MKINSCNQVPYDLQYAPDAAIFELPFKGSPEQGMLAWLDGQSMQEWWPADNVNIEPASNGMYYIAWKDPDLQAAFAVLGVFGNIDTERHFFEINKILLISPYTRFSNISIRVSFKAIDPLSTLLCLQVSSPFAGNVLQQFRELTGKLFELLAKRYVLHFDSASA